MAQTHRIAHILTSYQQVGRLVQEPPMLTFSSLIGPLFLSGTLGSLEPTLAQDLAEPKLIVQRFLKGHQITDEKPESINA